MGALRIGVIHHDTRRGLKGRCHSFASLALDAAENSTIVISCTHESTNLCSVEWKRGRGGSGRSSSPFFVLQLLMIGTTLPLLPAVVLLCRLSIKCPPINRKPSNQPTTAELLLNAEPRSMYCAFSKCPMTVVCRVSRRVLSLLYRCALYCN